MERKVIIKTKRTKMISTELNQVSKKVTATIVTSIMKRVMVQKEVIKVLILKHI